MTPCVNTLLEIGFMGPIYPQTYARQEHPLLVNASALKLIFFYIILSQTSQLIMNCCISWWINNQLKLLAIILSLLIPRRAANTEHHHFHFIVVLVHATANWHHCSKLTVLSLQQQPIFTMNWTFSAQFTISSLWLAISLDFLKVLSSPCIFSWFLEVKF